MNDEDDKIFVYELPEDTRNEIIDKISAMATSIREDWSDPRTQCRQIWRLCTKLKELIEP